MATDRFNGVVASKAIKVRCVVGAEANVAALENEQTIEAIGVVAGDRVLLTAQTDPIENGVWDVVSGGPWTRAADWDGNRDVEKGSTVWAGSSGQDDKLWQVQTAGTILPGSTATSITLLFNPAAPSASSLQDVTDIGAVTTNSVQLNGGSLLITEMTTKPDASLPTIGQIWVRDDAPNVLMFTDDVGNDVQLSGLAGVLPVGTVNDSSIIWTDPNWVENTSVRLGASNIKILESAAAAADTATYGQFWVRNDVAQMPMFTDEAGVDYELLGGGAGGQAVQWNVFVSGAGPSDPGSGNIRLSTGNPSSVAAFYISKTDDAGDDVSNVMDGQAAGSYFALENANDRSQYRIYAITSIVDNTTWWQVNVDYIKGAGDTSIAADETVNINFSSSAWTEGGAEVSNQSDLLYWENGTNRWESSGANIRVNVNSPPNGGRISLGSTTGFNVTYPMFQFNLGVNSACLYYVSQDANTGLYHAADMNASPDHLSWGTRNSAVNTELFEINRDMEIRVLADAAFLIAERASAATPVAAHGQFWVHSTTKNPMFTDENGVDYELNAAGAGGAGSIVWTYDNTVVAAADPGAGMVRFNTANPASFVWMVINDADVDGLDIQNIIDTMPAGGSHVVLRNTEDNTQYRVYSITAIANNIGWYQITLDYLFGNGDASITDGIDLTFEFFSSPSVEGGTETSLMSDLLYWEGATGRWEASGPGLRVNPSTPPTGGRIQLGTTSGYNTTSPQIMRPLGAADTVMDYVYGNDANNGFFQGYRRSTTPDEMIFGARIASVNTDLLLFTLDSQVVVEPAAAFMIGERAAQATVKTGYGEFWVRNDTNQTPMFTDEAGVDYELNATGRVVTDINTATPPTTEAVTGNFEIYDLEGVDLLATYGFNGSNELQIINEMYGAADTSIIHMGFGQVTALIGMQLTAEGSLFLTSNSTAIGSNAPNDDQIITMRNRANNQTFMELGVYGTGDVLKLRNGMTQQPTAFEVKRGTLVSSITPGLLINPTGNVADDYDGQLGTVISYYMEASVSPFPATRTMPVASGVFQVNTDGAGTWERVLTTSDLGGGIGGSITDNQIAVGATTADDIEGTADLTWDGSSLIAVGSLLDLDNSGAATATTIIARNSAGGITLNVNATTGNGQIGQTSGAGLAEDVWISMVRNGAVTLNHNNNAKFSTTATGAAVTGDITATSFNSVALTTGGAATNYLDETGAYSVPAGAGGGIGGSITDNQIAVGATTANDIEGSSDLTFDGEDVTIRGNAYQLQVHDDTSTGDVADYGWLHMQDDVFFVGGTDNSVAQFTAALSIDVVTRLVAVGNNAANLTLNGLVKTVPGGTDMLFGDNSEIQIGAGSDVIISSNGTNTTINVASGTLQFDSAGFFIEEQAAAQADKPNYGQIWVENLASNRMGFTNDAGDDGFFGPFGIEFRESASRPYGATGAAGGLLWLLDLTPNELAWTNDADQTAFMLNTNHELRYTFDTSTASGDPGTGDFRLNSATMASVTAIYINDADKGSYTHGSKFFDLRIGDVVEITSTTSGDARYQRYRVSDTVVDNTGWHTIAVAPMDTSTIFNSGEPVAISFTRMPDVLQAYEIANVATTPTGTTETLTFDQGPAFEVDLESVTGNITITISGGPTSGNYGQITVLVTQDSVTARTITWAGGTFEWPGDTAHVMNATLNGYSIFTFETWDGGTTWFAAGADYGA